jgi:hypothetical protein
MLLFFRMLEQRGLEIADAESGGFAELARGVQACRSCGHTRACVRWLKWRGRLAPAPLCPNAAYFDGLEKRRRPACP